MGRRGKHAKTAGRAGVPGDSPGADEPQLKRPRMDVQGGEPDSGGDAKDEVNGLAGLLSGYGTDDDSA